MDDVQNKVVFALQSNKQCLTEHNKLKSTLADIIPNDKMHCNLIMNAYDDGILKKFFENDVTLALLQFVQALTNNYGISTENALWSVVTWCYVVGKNEIANAIMSLNGSVVCGNMPSTNSLIEFQGEREITAGTYKVGVDFPVGTIRVRVKFGELAPDDDRYPVLFYGIAKKPSEISTWSHTIDAQGYIETENGDYVRFDNIGFYPIESLTIEQIR